MRDITLPLIALLALMLIFTIWPGLDLMVARLSGGPDGFPLAGMPLLETIRHSIWNLGLVLLVVLLTLWAISLRLSRWLRLPPAFWGRGALALLLGPGLLVNVILKAHWGRARPRELIEFGGGNHFTPPLLMAGDCPRNCGFPSGEGALAFTVALLIWCMVFAHAGPRTRFGGGTVLLALALTGAGLRMAIGAHFLSDTLFSAALCALVIGLLNHALPAPAATPADLRADLRMMRSRIARALRIAR